MSRCSLNDGRCNWKDDKQHNGSNQRRWTTTPSLNKNLFSKQWNDPQLNKRKVKQLKAIQSSQHFTWIWISEKATHWTRNSLKKEPWGSHDCLALQQPCFGQKDPREAWCLKRRRERSTQRWVMSSRESTGAPGQPQQQGGSPQRPKTLKRGLENNPWQPGEPNLRPKDSLDTSLHGGRRFHEGCDSQRRRHTDTLIKSSKEVQKEIQLTLSLGIFGWLRWSVCWWWSEHGTPLNPQTPLLGSSDSQN